MSYSATSLGGTPVTVAVTDGATSGVDAQLAPGASISGTVTDASGAPVAGLTVQVLARDGWRYGDHRGRRQLPSVRPARR